MMQQPYFLHLRVKKHFDTLGQGLRVFTKNVSIKDEMMESSLEEFLP